MSPMHTKQVLGICTTLLVVAPMSLGTRAQDPAASPSSAWRQVHYIKATNPGEGDQFGYAVAISGDGTTLAVGAPMEDGASAGIDGNQADDSADAAGAVYVYARRDAGWVPQAYLKASNADALDQFGNAVALSADGNTLAVAAYFEDSGATGVNGDQADNSIPQSGAVYIFSRVGTRWSQQAYLKASNTGEPDDGDTFGYAIALSADGDTLAVGAPSEDSRASGINAGDQTDNSAAAAGAVYVFARAGGRWLQQAYIKSSTRPEFTAGDLFGYGVSLSADGSTLVVGAYDEGGSSNAVDGPIDNQLPGAGAVFVFARRGAMWSPQGYLKASTQDRADSMGVWVAVSDDGDVVAAGAADEDTLAAGVNAVQSGHSGRVGEPDDISSGAAYVFTRAATRWSQQASFKASNPGPGDWFAFRLALSGDGNTLAVGAPNEDSAARGLDGTQTDDSAGEAGAVYVFTRGGDRWLHQAYVKASNTDEFDEFGSAVALSRDGRVMAVGARFEDGAAAGLDGSEASNSLSDSGAVYVYVR